ncbi:MAG: hypothetical protein JXN59_06760 [Anaerolineae bacterium]|nr:hypothetical protein [Anaerolineae bacterium]
MDDLPVTDRLQSALLALRPLNGTPVRRVLEVGCGADVSVKALRRVFPTAALFGLDRDWRVVPRHPAAFTFVADAARLPVARHVQFDLVLIRHPDVYRSRTGWLAACAALPARVTPGGHLLVSCYESTELRQIERALTQDGVQGVALPVQRLLPVDLSGRDRYILAFQAGVGR